MGRGKLSSETLRPNSARGLAATGARFSAADDIGNPTLRDLAESDRSVGRPRAGKQEEDVKFEIGDRQGTRRRPVKNQRGVKRKRKMTDGTS